MVQFYLGISFFGLKIYSKIGFLSDVNPLLICIQFCCLFTLLKSQLRMIGVNKFVLYFVLSSGVIGVSRTLAVTITGVRSAGSERGALLLG